MVESKKPCGADRNKPSMNDCTFSPGTKTTFKRSQQAAETRVQGYDCGLPRFFQSSSEELTVITTTGWIRSIIIIISRLLSLCSSLGEVYGLWWTPSVPIWLQASKTFACLPPYNIHRRVTSNIWHYWWVVGVFIWFPAGQRAVSSRHVSQL